MKLDQLASMLNATGFLRRNGFSIDSRRKKKKKTTESVEIRTYSKSIGARTPAGSSSTKRSSQKRRMRLVFPTPMSPIKNTRYTSSGGRAAAACPPASCWLGLVDPPLSDDDALTIALWGFSSSLLPQIPILLAVTRQSQKRTTKGDCAQPPAAAKKPAAATGSHPPPKRSLARTPTSRFNPHNLSLTVPLFSYGQASEGTTTTDKLCQSKAHGSGNYGLRPIKSGYKSLQGE